LPRNKGGEQKIPGQLGKGTAFYGLTSSTIWTPQTLRTDLLVKPEQRGEKGKTSWEDTGKHQVVAIHLFERQPAVEKGVLIDLESLMKKRGKRRGDTLIGGGHDVEKDSPASGKPSPGPCSHSLVHEKKGD